MISACQPDGAKYWWSTARNLSVGTRVKHNFTLYLEPIGKKQSYDFTANKCLGDDTILDIDSILGIQRDKPILFSIPQRTVSTGIPEVPKKRKRETVTSLSEADKANYRIFGREEIHWFLAKTKINYPPSDWKTAAAADIPDCITAVLFMLVVYLLYRYVPLFPSLRLRVVLTTDICRQGRKEERKGNTNAILSYKYHRRKKKEKVKRSWSIQSGRLVGLVSYAKSTVILTKSAYI